MRGRIGGFALHSRVNSTEHLAPARKGFLAKFEHEVDPDGVLDPAERTRRAHAAMRAHMSRLAMKSSQARAARKSA